MPAQASSQVFTQMVDGIDALACRKITRQPGIGDGAGHRGGQVVGRQHTMYQQSALRSVVRIHPQHGIGICILLALHLLAAFVEFPGEPLNGLRRQLDAGQHPCEPCFRYWM